MTEGPRLLIRLGSMGDVILSTAVASAWKERLGNSPLDVLVKEEWAPLWKNHPAVRQVWSLPKDGRGMTGLPGWVPTLRNARYQGIIDLQGSLRSRTLTILARYRNVRRPERCGEARRRLVRTKSGGPVKTFRMLQAFLDTVEPGQKALPSVYPSQAAVIEASRLLRDCGNVALIPSAMHATKRWPVERYAVLGSRLAAKQPGKKIPVIWGPDDMVYERAFRAVWPREDEWVSIRKPLETVGAILQQMAVVVTNDSGLMHLAAAVGSRVLAIFGPTVEEFGFFPSGEGHRVLEVNLPCRPCSLHGGKRCPKLHFKCMLDQKVDHVDAVLEDMVGMV